MKRKKTLAELKRVAQKVFNKFIRERDSEDGWFTCISCGRVKKTDQMDAGHFYPVKGYDGLRFDENNVHGECKSCNGFDQMHVLGDSKSLQKKLGKMGFAKLEDRAARYKMFGYKFTRMELQEIIDKYK